MRNNILLPLLFLISSFVMAQKVEVLHRSDFRHNYVVGQFVYIENPADTNRLKYIATLQIQQNSYAGAIGTLIERFITEGKNLGANSFILQSYKEVDATITLTIRSFFGSEKFLEENEQRRDKGKIYVFSAEKKLKTKQFFYVNDSLIEFPSDSCYVLTPPDKQFMRITAYKTKLFKPFGYTFKKEKKSSFLIIDNHLNIYQNTLPALAISIFSLALSGGTYIIVPVYSSQKKDMEESYNHGRILLDMYKVKHT